MVQQDADEPRFLPEVTDHHLLAEGNAQHLLEPGTTRDAVRRRVAKLGIDVEQH